MPLLSPLQKARLQFQPKLPKALQNIQLITLEKSESARSATPSKQIMDLFPLTHEAPYLKFIKEPSKKNAHSLHVGVLLSGGQAPGGHNVIAGLYDALRAINSKSTLLGFLNGPSGLIKNKAIEINEKSLSEYRNQGGFDLIGSGRNKIETPDQFKSALATAAEHKLDGLVVIGGDDSNTNAAALAEYFAAHQCKTTVIGVPKTIDGDLKNEEIEISFGFDTAAKCYSETIGSLMRDIISAKKYYCFVKLMGRSASHITLECALQTHPNLAFISEEVLEKKLSLHDIVESICNLVCKRAATGKEYGVILIPEGVVEFIPEVKKLIEELNGLLAESSPQHAALERLNRENEKIEYVSKLLSKESLVCFKSLPKENQMQLLIDRDAHGNVQVSRIETERMLIEMVKEALKERAKNMTYNGSFNTISHFCGYEGRSCLPSNFDSQYCYALGYVAAALINGKANGYICRLANLTKPVEEWMPGGVPLTSLLTIEERHGKSKAVIEKALVDLKGKPFAHFDKLRSSWEESDGYIDPGPIQFFGASELTDDVTMTLKLES
jgi:pyrophosphate--fructose-6-phosphate 1-phosphotransferase